MVVGTRDFLRVLVLLPTVWLVGCAVGSLPSNSSTSSSSSGSSGGIGTDLGPCGLDCAKIKTPQCTVAVCNTGQEVGPINSCVVVAAPDGTACDDGMFCTVDDACSKGTCVGGGQNDCGTPAAACMAVICYEDSQSCDVTPVDDGTACTPTNLCQINGTCKVGDCVGEPKDCTFSPLNECNTVACDPTTGKCEGTPDPTKNDTPCLLTGDACSVNKTCMAGQCGGGTPKDCSALDVGCQIGVCDSATGTCGPAPALAGTACSDGIAECYVGTCDAKGDCGPSSLLPDGTACNDHDACTSTDTCTAGVCAGGAVAGCVLYFQEGFETCPDNWTFGGGWQCGTPSNSAGPPSARTGHGCIATGLASDYDNNQTFAVAVADSPSIDLTKATNPQLSFWVWDWTEGGTFDGWNLDVSSDGGHTFTEVMNVTPAYSLTIASESAWGGDYSAQGWQNYLANLTPWAGGPIVLRFAFRSDPATVFPGVFIDDIVVAEPAEIPLYVSTSSPLPDVYAGQGYSASITSTGGTGNGVWSINAGGVNDAWLTIDPATGVLSGTPAAANVGAVSVTVHVQEPTMPSNFAEQTFTFNVASDVYYTSFEGPCPDGWTLTGGWQCGVPTNTAGPVGAYAGTQCISTGLTTDYSPNETWAGTTATSPAIDLTGVADPVLTFRMWIDTEGSTYDGANLAVSADGGLTYTVLPNTVPQYPLTIGGEPAWGGHQAALGWQLVQADLSTYANQTIRLQFAFRSDPSGNYAGVFIDDILIN